MYARHLDDQSSQPCVPSNIEFGRSHHLRGAMYVEVMSSMASLRCLAQVSANTAAGSGSSAANNNGGAGTGSGAAAGGRKLLQDAAATPTNAAAANNASANTQANAPPTKAASTVGTHIISGCL